MRLTEKLANLKASGLEKLRFDGKVLGLRIKVFDAVSECWSLYDFSLDIVTDPELRKYLNSQTYANRELIETESSFCTQDELDGLQVIECHTESDVRKALEPLEKLQSYKGVVV